MDPMPLSQHRDTVCQLCDWIMFSDPYEKPIIILHQGLHAIGANPCEEIPKTLKHTSDQRATRPFDARNSSCNSMKISIKGRNLAFRTESDLFSPNPELVRKATPQSRPSSHRLPTPDLPDIEERVFWPSLKAFHDCKVVNTSVLQTAQAQILCANDNIAKLDIAYDQYGQNVNKNT